MRAECTTLLLNMLSRVSSDKFEIVVNIEGDMASSFERSIPLVFVFNGVEEKRCALNSI